MKRSPPTSNLAIRLAAALGGVLVAASIIALVPPRAAVPTGRSSLTAGESLTPGQYLCSSDGQFRLVLQPSDGNLVLFDPASRPLWSSHTASRGAVRASMQADGNFVIYNSSSTPIWETRTWGHPGASLTLQTDANLVVHAPAGGAFWTTIR